MDMEKQKVYFQDWGLADYGQAWDRQESLLNENVDIKTQARLNGHNADPLSLSELGGVGSRIPNMLPIVLGEKISQMVGVRLPLP